MKENGRDSEISVKDLKLSTWHWGKNLQNIPPIQRHKRKLWVEIKPRISCLQKHSQPYNTLSHFYALENFHP